MSSLWRRIETLILPRRFHRSWQTSFGSFCVGRGVMSPRNWLASGFRGVSTVSFFRLRRALAETLPCISQTPQAGCVVVRNRAEVLAALRRPHCGEAWPVAIRFRRAKVRAKLFPPPVFRTDLLAKNQKVSSRDKLPTQCPPTGVFWCLN